MKIRESQRGICHKKLQSHSYQNFGKTENKAYVKETKKGMPH